MIKTMEQAIQNFIAARAAEHGASGNTLAAYATDLAQLAEYLTQRHQVDHWDAVEAEHLRAFLALLQQHKFAPTTVARKLAASKAFFRHLVATAALPASPAAALRAPRVEKTPPRALDAAAIAGLFAQLHTGAPAGQRDAAMLHLLYATGLRVSEVVALDVDDLNGMDSDHPTVICRGRGERTRTLPLAAADVRAALAAYLDTARAHLLHGSASAAFFVNQRGERLTRQGFWLIVTGYARAAGIKDLTPHTLRHSFALALITHGVEMRTVRDLLGHANLSTTQMYRPLRPDAAPHPAAETAEGSADATVDGAERAAEQDEAADTLVGLDGLDPVLTVTVPTEEQRPRNPILRPGGH